MEIIYIRLIIKENNGQLSKLIAASRYARFLPEHKRRETWDETVDRLASFIKDNAPGLIHELPKLTKASKT